MVSQHMPVIAGVDGAREGWLVVWQDAAGRIDSARVTKPEQVCRAMAPADVIAVDVPIGLTDAGPRACDRAARQAIGARRSSVFSPPSRPVLSHETREAASAAQKALDGRGIGVQAWGIVPKICAWDTYLRSSTRARTHVFEVHPEVSFAALKGSALRHGKKSLEGRAERRRLLLRHFGAEPLDNALHRYARRDVAEDDVYDAFAALWTAARIREGTAETLPAAPEKDGAGLPMAIWY